MANVTSLLKSLCDNFKSSASTSRPGTLPSQTVTNPRQQINAITTRSGKTLEEPSTPLVPTPDVSNPQNEPNLETSTEKVQNPNLENTAHVPSPGEEDSIFMEIPKPKAKKTVNVEVQDLNSPDPNSYQSKLPYPERMKVRENDKPSAQHSRFLKMFKQLRLEMALTNRCSCVKMPKFNIVKARLLWNPKRCRGDRYYDVNADCSAIIMKKVLEKLEIGKIPYPINVNPLFEENDKDAEIKSSSSFTLTSPDESDFEAYLKKDWIPPEIDFTHPPPLEVSSSNPTSPTLTGEKNFHKDLTVSFDSFESSILPSPLLDFDSPFTAELSASVTLNSLGNEGKVFKPGILVYHAIYDKNLVTLEENLKKNISSGTLLVFNEPSFLLPPPEPQNECLKNVVLNFYQSNVEDVNSFTIIIWIFLLYFPYTKESPLIFSFRSENFVFDPGIVTFHKPVVWICQISQEISQKRTRERMSDQEAKDLKSRSQRNHASAFYSQTTVNPNPAPLFQITQGLFLQ
ncbi:hypothetical protein Tco_0337217 [Tanacetum coccineum]